MRTVSFTRFDATTWGLPSVGDLVSSIDQFACAPPEGFCGLEASPNKRSKHLKRSLSSVIALHDFTSEGTSSGGIAIDAVELKVTRKPNIARARIVAIMRLSS